MSLHRIIDVHAHILPGVDDGSQSFEESLALVRLELQQGISGMIATPHFRRAHDSESVTRHELGKTPEQLARIADELDAKINTELSSEIKYNANEINRSCATSIEGKGVADTFTLALGQELRYHEDLADSLTSGKCLTLAGSRYALIEFGTDADYEYMFRGLRKIIEAGYTPILAHMERYMFLDGVFAGPDGADHRRVRELRKMGCRMQMSYDSLYSDRKSTFGRLLDVEVKRCHELVREGYIDLLGTDMHSLDFRPPEIGQAIKWLEKNLSPDEIDRITYVNAENIINNTKIV